MTGVDRIQRRKIGHISQKHGYLYHMAQVPADGFEHCLKVREDARRLGAYIPFNELSCCWVLSHLAREEEARSRSHQMREGPNRLHEFWSIDPLSLRHSPPFNASAEQQG